MYTIEEIPEEYWPYFSDFDLDRDKKISKWEFEDVVKTNNLWLKTLVKIKVGTPLASGTEIGDFIVRDRPMPKDYIEAVVKSAFGNGAISELSITKVPPEYYPFTDLMESGGAIDGMLKPDELHFFLKKYNVWKKDLVEMKYNPFPTGAKIGQFKVEDQPMNDADLTAFVMKFIPTTTDKVPITKVPDEYKMLIPYCDLDND